MFLLNNNQASQYSENYSNQAHINWKKLLEEQLVNLEGKASHNFMQGLIKIRDFVEDIPNIFYLSQFLQAQTG